MGNLGPMEFLVIAAIALIVLGPKKLPDFGRGLGKAMREFNKARSDFMDSLHEATYSDDDSRWNSRSSTSHYDYNQTSSYPDNTQARESGAHAAAAGVDESEDALPYGGDFPVPETAGAALPQYAGAASSSPTAGGMPDDGFSGETSTQDRKD